MIPHVVNRFLTIFLLQLPTCLLKSLSLLSLVAGMAQPAGQGHPLSGLRLSELSGTAKHWERSGGGGD